MTQALFPRLLVIGLGLIGSSLALAAKKSGVVSHVLGWDKQTDISALALSQGVIDEICQQPQQALQQLDLVVLAVPVGATLAVLEQLSPYLTEDTLITDVASVKGSVINAAQAAFGDIPANLVPAHPIAGREHSGVLAADSELFCNHRVIITPVPKVTSQSAIKQISALWQAVGARVVSMTAERHDQLLAATSHLPHLLAFNLVAMLAGYDESLDIFRYAAGGFRDFTRIAGSDPVMWHDIALDNRQAILHQLDLFSQQLGQLRVAIAEQDSEYLQTTFSCARQARQHFVKLFSELTET
jgi:3-phosphoshikimate 1-carboxyvinyltransferase